MVVINSTLTLSGLSPVLGTKHLELEWLVPKTRLRSYKGERPSEAPDSIVVQELCTSD